MNSEYPCGLEQIRSRGGTNVGQLIAHWDYDGFLAGLLLPCWRLSSPLLASAARATFLCLPVYMVHQYEEHDSERSDKS